MFPNEILTATPRRVRWLCVASTAEAEALCADARVDDPAGVHCARFGLHLVQGVPLPAGYAWEVLRSPEYSNGQRWIQAPFEHHVRTMAMYAADLLVTDADFETYCDGDFSDLQRAAVVRFARSPLSLTDERLLELSYSDNHRVRRAVVQVLRKRESPNRKDILKRLVCDTDRVSFGAGLLAAHLHDPELNDLLAETEHYYALSFVGDPRAHWRAEHLVKSDDPLNWEEAVFTAAAYRDRELMAKMWEKPEWETCRLAIRVSVSEDLIDDSQIAAILDRETADHVADLLFQWPESNAGRLPLVADGLRRLVPSFPPTAALAAGRTDSVEWVRARIPSDPVLCGATIRLLPLHIAESLVREMIESPHAGARAVGANLVATRELKECFPLVAELCPDVDEEVSKAATRAIAHRGMCCGLYGFDTAILRAGSEIGAAFLPRHELDRLVEAILAEAE